MVQRFPDVLKYINKKIQSEKGLVFLQIDPPKFTPEQASQIAKMADKSGIAAFAVGGSVGAQGKHLDDIILALKENSKIPIILFPGGVAGLSHLADAIYFYSMLNSNDPYFLAGGQIAAALPVKKLGIEVIPSSYIIIEPGRAVGWIGHAQLIPRNLPYLAAVTSLAGQFLGSQLIILESGGGADRPAPPQMVEYTKKMIDVPLLIAGGVKNEKFISETIAAGADIVQIGTAVEELFSQPKKLEERLAKFVEAARKAGKARKF